jgi:hypothetical protein
MNDKFEKSMEQIFDVTSSTLEQPETKSKKTKVPALLKKDMVSIEPDLKEDLTDAYNQSRENLQDIIDQGKEAMGEILEIAKQGQHPRAFEVYATLLKNMTDANDRLLKIQKEMRDMDGNKKEKTNTTIDKAIFVGSTSELSKMLKGK